MTTSRNKRLTGRYFTKGNPFRHPAFTKWAAEAGLPERRLLEPFAGGNNLIGYLTEMGLCRSFRSYDIEPAHPAVTCRDTLADFPEGYEVCVTNPPWLARNSAAARGLPFPDTSYDDLYKTAVGVCLEHCGYVAALTPESYIRSGVFTNRLSVFVSLTFSLFADTGHPVGLALFTPDSGVGDVWSGMDYVGRLGDLRQLVPHPVRGGPRVCFNAPDGNVGLIALDNTVGPSIRFCEPGKLAHYRVKKTGRHITKLEVGGEVSVAVWNEHLNRFRSVTKDTMLTAYRGVRKDGSYRRRLDWRTARGIIHNTT